MLPPLRKKEKHKVRIWKITIDRFSYAPRVAVFTESGEEGGSIRQTAPTFFQDSKTKTALELATTFATAKWRSRIRGGYQETLEKKPTFVRPMSAVPIEPFLHKIRFPAWIQPKLDGYRCLARKKNHQVELLSKRGLSFLHLEKIKKDLASQPWFKHHPQGYLDGELYLHHRSMNDLKRVLGRKELDPASSQLEKEITYHIFDGFDDLEQPFGQRLHDLQKNIIPSSTIFLVPTEQVKSLAEIEQKKKTYLEEDYEGVVVRNDHGTYRSGKKSMDVLRTKEFHRAKFQIIDAIEARGENAGTVIWVVRCQHHPSKTFLARPMGTREERKKWWQHRKEYIGRWLEVKYMELDKTSGCVSRFPIGIRIL